MPDDIDVGHVVGLPPERAIAYFRDKGHAISWNWPEVWQQQHARAFTVAKAVKPAVLRDIRGAVDKALAEGMTFRQFERELAPKLIARGWWGRQERRNIHTGELELVQLGSRHRLKTIFRANIRTARAAAHYEFMKGNAGDRPYWMYDALNDGRTRPSHREMDNLVFRHDDPFWDTHYPPNGWNCRCRVRALTERQVRERGLAVGRSRPSDFAPVGHTVTGGHQVETTSFRGLMAPDPGWNHRPGLPAPAPAGPPGSVGGAGWIDSLGGEVDAGDLAPIAAGASWHELGRPQWREVAAVPAAPQLVSAAGTRRDARRILVERLREEGLEPARARRPDGRLDLYLARVETPDDLDDVWISYQAIRHVVLHHPNDTRERFVDYVLPTIRRPSEVWLGEAERGGGIVYERRFLGRFEDGRSLVVVDRWDGDQWWILWTFFPTSRPRGLDSYRRGALLYERRRDGSG